MVLYTYFKKLAPHSFRFDAGKDKKGKMHDSPASLNQMLLEAMERYRERPCFKIRQGGRYQDISYQRFQTLVFRMTRFLRDQAVGSGERVAIAGDNSLEWMVLYMATLLAGGVAVPLRHSLAPETLRLMLDESGSRVLAVDGEEFLSALLPVSFEAQQLPGLKTILFMQDTTLTLPDTLATSAILAETEKVPAAERKALQDYALSLPPERRAVIHYTAGESGRPRGAVFDHGRLAQAMLYLPEWFGLDEEDLAFTVVPWTYHTSLYVAMHYFLSGVCNVLAENDKTALENMEQTSPTVTLNMPFFLERLYENILANVSQMPESSREVFHWAVGKGREFHAAGSNASEELREKYSQADLTFFTRFRGQMGGRMRRFYSVGAPLSENLADFFEAIGLPVLNLYSVTEAGGFPAINRLADRRLGSCGRVASGFEICIAGDGEVLVRGDTMMVEYWSGSGEMSQRIDAQGWLHTGDLGYFDQDGYLYLSGRKQPFMVLSTGRKIVPAHLEEALMASPLISHAVVFGEGRPYVSALIVPDVEVMVNYFQQQEIGEPIKAADANPLQWIWPRDGEGSRPLITTAHPVVKTLLDKAIAEVNRQLDRWEHIKRYSLIDQAHSETANELAELVAAGRHLVAERYARQIKEMYPQGPQVARKEVTHVGVSPERMRELLEKESILDAWLADAGIEFLFRLARTKQIDAPSLVHVCDAVATIAQAESEEKPLSTAIIVGDPMRIARVLPPSQINLLRHDHIRRLRHFLVTLCKIVDGIVLGYLVDKHGYVRGVHKITGVPIDDQPAGSFLLGPQFRRHAAVSQLCDALVFFVPRGGQQARVFADGQLVGRYSNGDWSPENISKVDEKLARLAEEKQYDLPLLRRVLRCAFQMSEENLGAIFIIGNADLIMERADAPEISHIALIVSTSMEHMSDAELINFAKQDGATIIDVHGRFRGCMVLLRPGAHTQAEIGPGKGARHSSAAKISAETGCLAITVSQDGPITVYDSGHRVLSL